MRARLSVCAALCSGLLAACGGSETGGLANDAEPREPAQREPRAPSRTLPGAIPLRSSGAADAARASVIRRWADALRAGDIERAARTWAVPAKVQNGTPLLALVTRDDVRAFNSSLQCGSRVTSTGGAENGFTIATVRLTRRPGADCGAGVGGSARVAIRVVAGKIAEWYRLPDDPDAPAPQPQLPRDVPVI